MTDAARIAPVPGDVFDAVIRACSIYPAGITEDALRKGQGLIVSTSGAPRAAVLDVIGREVARQVDFALDEYARR